MYTAMLKVIVELEEESAEFIILTPVRTHQRDGTPVLDESDVLEQWDSFRLDPDLAGLASKIIKTNLLAIGHKGYSPEKIEEYLTSIDTSDTIYEYTFELTVMKVMKSSEKTNKETSKISVTSPPFIPDTRRRAHMF